MLNNEELVSALEDIRLQDREGKLRPRSVVDTAADPDHPLHDSFEWNDSKAADQHRLAQARRLIARAKVIYIHDTTPIETRAYVNLDVERRSPDQLSGETLGSTGAYQPVGEVLRGELSRRRLLWQLYNKLLRLRNKYHHLHELAAVWGGIDDCPPPPPIDPDDGDGLPHTGPHHNPPTPGGAASRRRTVRRRRHRHRRDDDAA